MEHTTEQAVTETTTEAPTTSSSVPVQEAQFPEAPPSDARGTGAQVELLLDANMPISVGLGQTNIRIRDLLQLAAGSVVRLDKKAGEPVELYLRGIKFATGHLVVVGDQLAVRIKEILSTDVIGKGT